MLEKIEERTNFGPILIGPFLLNLCHGNAMKSLYSVVAIQIIKGKS